MTMNNSQSTPGKTFGWLDVTTLASGMSLRLPLHRITGATAGPVLGITASIHGDEYLPIEVVRQVVAQLDPAQLRGTVIAMPVANPLAFEAQTRNLPIDMLNLNRVFPGDRNGWLTEQLAAAITDQFLPQVQYLIDLHAGGAQPTVDYVYILNDEGMSRAFGFPVMYRPAKTFGGTLSDAAVSRGIHNMVVEMGGGMLANESYIDRGLRGVFNVLMHLKMLPGDPGVPARQTIVTEMAVIRPHFGGLLYPELTLKEIGTIVPRNTLMGKIISPYTFETLEELRAPFDRSLMILLRGAITKAHPGDYAYMVGNADSDS
jgi:predicted deacylase